MATLENQHILLQPYLLVLLICFSSCNQEVKRSDNSSRTSYINEELILNTPIELTKFKTVTNFSNKLEFKIPESFQLMEQKDLNSKFPNEYNRPTVVYTNKSNTFNIAFNYTNHAVTVPQLGNIKKDIDEQFQLISTQFLSSDITKINGTTFIIMKYTNMYEGNLQSNTSLITSLEGKLLMSNISYPESKSVKFNNVVSQMKNSFRIKG